MEPIRKLKFDQLAVEIYASAEDMAIGVSEQIKTHIINAFKTKEMLAAIMATGNSQIPYLKRISTLEGIDWGRITLFHMDEYLGIKSDHPASFRKYLKERVESLIHPRTFHYLEGDADQPIDECERYADLLRAQAIDFCCLGIGENGHIAFNDPHVADFEDPRTVKIVSLDTSCRQQQVNEGCFPSVDAVPPYALTLTIPTLCSADKLFCVVPERRKADAVKRAMTGPIEPSCPASWLRTQGHATLYLDTESASQLAI